MAAFGKGSHLHLIDGSGFIFRAYHALPPLTRKSDGLPIGAVAGFCNMVWKMLQETKGADAPTHVAVIFDKSEVTFRNELYPDYKQNRPPAPDDLVPQFRLIRDATRAFNLPCIEMGGFEADDIIATYATQAAAAGGRVTVISADKDLMQLVGPGIEMFDTLKNRAIGPDEVLEKFGVGPDRVIDVQALAGDSVDNVPGAPGIGIKTAAQLITEYGDLDTLLARAGEIKQPKRREVLLGHAEQIRVSRALVTLRRDVPLEDPLEALEVRDPNSEALLPFLSEMEFRALAGRVAAKLGVAPPVIEPVAEAQQGPATAFAREPVPVAPVDPAKYVLVRDAEALAGWVARIAERGAVAIEVGTGAADEMRAPLVGIALALGPGEAAYVPVAHVSGSGGLFDEPVEGQVPLEAALALLGPVLEDPAVLKIGQNVKATVKLLARHGIRLGPIDDTMLVSYALHAGLHGHGIDYLSEAYLGHVPVQLKALTGGGRAARGFAQLSVEEAGRYAGEQAEVVWRLWQALKPRLPFSRVTRVYETMERPLVPVLGEMERAGVKVDRQALSRLSGDFAQRMAALEEEIYGLAGGRFNLGSPEAAGRGAVRPDGDGRRAEGQDRGLHHGGGRAGGAGGAGARPAGAHAGLAAPVEAEVHLHRHAAGRDQPGDGAGAHLLPDRRGGHRAAGLDRAEPAEHPDPHRRGPADPRGVRGGAGQRAGQPRLFADRAAHPRPRRADRRAEAGVPATASTSTR